MSLNKKPDPFANLISGGTNNQPGDWDDEQIKQRLLALSEEKDRVLIDKGIGLEREAWRAEVERIRKEIEADNEHDPDTGWSPDVFTILRRLLKNMEAKHGKV